MHTKILIRKYYIARPAFRQNEDIVLCRNENGCENAYCIQLAQDAD
jgi:hypothetical protein